MWHIFILLFSLTFADKSAVEEFTNANNLFARSAYTEIAKIKNGSFLFSPFSAETVLALAESGSRGETAEEIRTSLHLPNDKTKVESAIKTLLPNFRSSSFYTLFTANKIYLKDNFTVKNEFKNVATSVYQADSESIDFTKNVEAANNINSWVEKHTNSKIKNLIDAEDLDRYTRAVLINALYFKANWSNPFLLVNTDKADFYRTPTDVVKVDTLNHNAEYFDFYECPHLEAQFLELPFQEREASMLVVLPNKKNGLLELEKQLDKVLSPQHDLKSTFLNVALPKFRIESSVDLKSVLLKLGVKKAFDENQADLSGISGNPGDLYIKKVLQKTFIDVSEQGVEAAAASVVYAAFPPSARLEEPKNFVADHPFIFYIKVKDLVIFVGRVTDP